MKSERRKLSILGNKMCRKESEKRAQGGRDLKRFSWWGRKGKGEGAHFKKEPSQRN